MLEQQPEDSQRKDCVSIISGVALPGRGHRTADPLPDDTKVRPVRGRGSGSWLRPAM